MCGGGKTSQSSAVSKTQLGKQNPPLAENIGSHVIAILQYGDPRRIKGMSYNKGTAKGEGVRALSIHYYKKNINRLHQFFPRTKDQLCSSEVASKVESWCDSGDTFCDTGANIVAHLDYTLKYNDEAAQFIQGKIDASNKGGSPASSSSSTSSGAVSAPAAAKNSFGSKSGGSSSALGSLGSLGSLGGGKSGGSSSVIGSLGGGKAGGKSGGLDVCKICNPSALEHTLTANSLTARWFWKEKRELIVNSLWRVPLLEDCTGHFISLFLHLLSGERLVEGW